MTGGGGDGGVGGGGKSSEQSPLSHQVPLQPLLALLSEAQPDDCQPSTKG